MNPPRKVFPFDFTKTDRTRTARVHNRNDYGSRKNRTRCLRETRNIVFREKIHTRYVRVTRHGRGSAETNSCVCSSFPKKSGILTTSRARNVAEYFADTG